MRTKLPRNPLIMMEWAQVHVVVDENFMLFNPLKNSSLAIGTAHCLIYGTVVYSQST